MKFIRKTTLGGDKAKIYFSRTENDVLIIIRLTLMSLDYIKKNNRMHRIIKTYKNSALTIDSFAIKVETIKEILELI